MTIAAAYAKNRRQDTLPLRPATASLLKGHLRGKMPQAQAFVVPGKTHVAAMFRADLADARRAWLESHQTAQERLEAEQSPFLSPVDHEGRYADFHALRHTFISNLAAGGVHPKTAQRLARHSTITLTMDRYTHLHSVNLTAALDVLPDLSVPRRPVILATGTDGRSLSLHLSPNSGCPKTSVELGGVGDRKSSKTKTPAHAGVSRRSPEFSDSERDGTRTRNHRIDSPVL